MQYWTHQQRGIEFVRDKAGSLLWYGMGSGKTLTSIGIMRDQEAQLILISCPKPVVRTWISEFEKHTNNEFDIIAPLTGSVEKKTKEIEKQLKYFGKNKKPKVVIVNYESIWRPGMGPVYDKFKNLTSTGVIRGQDWDLVFVDECFVKDTLIDTPMGSVKIQDLKIGDFVYGYDHDVEKVIPTKIREIIVNTVPSRNLCGFNGLTTTMGHPFFVEDNYKMAGLIDPENDFLWKRNEYGKLEKTKVSGLWRAVDGEAKQKMVTRQKKKSGKKWSFLLSSMLFKMGKEQSRNDGTIIKNLGNKTWKNPKTKVFDMQQTTDNKTDTISFEEEKGIKKRRYEIFLREILLCNMENGSTRNKSKNIYKGDERESFFEIKGSMDTKSRDKKNCRSKGKLSRESLCEKQNRKCSESPRKIKETWIQIFKRREWPWFYDCPGFIIKFVKKTISRIFLGNRTCVYELSSGISERPPLPNRYSKSDFKVGDRGRWSISPISACCSEGQKKNKNLESKWLDSDEIQEQRNYIESTKSIMVYNIETETNNYFADGILNHNCQKLKSAGSKVSMFFKALRPKTKKRIGLSGTPTPNSPLDIYGIYRFLDPDIFGTSYQRFQMKYALMGGFENYTVLKIINQQELN